ncbi:tripartite motif-containing protein 29-like [Pygocentrus nattereri]|uniref:tripartite motif-containing protein 29-like n=1 Tax=Pygocentrus nattereri TaxID=42514 RepID=UPI0008148A5D|nr:tripartite motif-containing protein 29-like [Pygocentrus nattereri]
MAPPVAFTEEREPQASRLNKPDGTVSPAPTCTAAKSSQSMDPPVTLRLMTGLSKRKLRAVKSCLTCSTTYCETHVKQHYTVAALQRHTLVKATGELEQRLCKLHHRALEVFCKTDQTFICFICTMEEHE